MSSRQVTRRLFVPPLRSALKLAEDWTFTVFSEYRNRKLIDYFDLENTDFFRAREERRKELFRLAREAGDRRDYAESSRIHRELWAERNANIGEVTLPAGIVLIVDRIYIRQGGDRFDSMTFRAQLPNKAKPKSKRPISIRFWCKLDDANLMVIEDVELGDS